MCRRIILLGIAAALILASASAASGSGAGLFGVLSGEEGADERLNALEKTAEQVSASVVTDQYAIEVSQAYYEGNRIYISYRASGTLPGMQDGIDLEDGSYADIIFGDETVQEDGSVIGWKECIVPDGKNTDSQTFSLVFGPSEENRIRFTLNRNDYDQYLQGVSSAETCQARAEIARGKVDLKGTVRLISPEQAASWIAWQEGEEETGTDVIVCWNLYRNGEPVSIDLFAASRVNGTDEVVFDVMFPYLEDINGLSLVPEYSQGGENFEEAIPREPVIQEQ